MTRLLDCGPGAVLAEYESTRVAGEVALRLGALEGSGITDVVAGARTVLVLFDHRPAELATLMEPVAAGSEPPPGPPVTIPVRYDGADLAAVAAATSSTADAVVALHSSAVYTAAFCGFAPGFSYLVGLPEALWLPRRDTPRASVPAGSVAIADVYTGVYPTASPGGWHLLGHTDVTMFDARRRPPTLLPPGTRVRFMPA